MSEHTHTFTEKPIKGWITCTTVFTGRFPVLCFWCNNNEKHWFTHSELNLWDSPFLQRTALRNSSACFSSLLIVIWSLPSRGFDVSSSPLLFKSIKCSCQIGKLLNWWPSGIQQDSYKDISILQMSVYIKLISPTTVGKHDGLQMWLKLNKP